jgi:ferredoxin
MFCGLCVEACPYDALFMGSGFEQSAYSRKGRVIDIDQLRQAEKLPSTFFRPQLESARYEPQGGQPLDWVDVGRESWRWHQREKAGMRLQASDESQATTTAGAPFSNGEDAGVEPADEAVEEVGPVSGGETA